MSDNDNDLMEQLVEHLKVMPTGNGYCPRAHIRHNGSGWIAQGNESNAVESWSSIKKLRKMLAGSRLHDAEQRVINSVFEWCPEGGNGCIGSRFEQLKSDAAVLRKLRAENE